MMREKNGRHNDGCHDNLGAEVGPEGIVAEERTVLVAASDVLVFDDERYSYRNDNIRRRINLKIAHEIFKKGRFSI